VGPVTAGLGAIVLLGALSACGEPTSAGVTTLVVRTATSGVSLDPDGYVVRVDRTGVQPIGDNDSVAVPVVGDGAHEAYLSQLAANCALTGDSVRSVPAAPGDTARVEFEVSCRSATGAMRVTTRTTGHDIDPNGFTIVIDGAAEPGAADPNGVYAVTIATGHHIVALTDLTPNCAPADGGSADELSREVDVGGGPAVDVAFELACSSAAPAGPGHEIAFVTDRLPLDGNAPQRIYVMNDDGTGLRPSRGLPDDELDGLQWLPDGSGLSFLSSTPDGTEDSEMLSTLILATGVIDTIREVHEFDAPAWSPDGSLVAFTDSDPENGIPPQVWVADRNGDAAHQISSDTVPHRSPTWSPDGTRLAYATRSDRVEVMRTAIVVRALAGGPESVLLDGFPGEVLELAWSPDGSRLAFVGLPDFRVDTGGVGQIYTVSATGGQVHQLTHDETDSDEPSWSPDGTRIAFSSQRDGDFNIYVMLADGSHPIRLTSNPSNDEYPAWRP
jgi:WD40-like Beta Propeller Repeat